METVFKCVRGCRIVNYFGSLLQAVQKFSENEIFRNSS